MLLNPSRSSFMRLWPPHHKANATRGLDVRIGREVESRERVRQQLVQVNDIKARSHQAHLGETLITIAATESKRPFQPDITQHNPQMGSDVPVEKADVTKLLEDKRTIDRESLNTGIHMAAQRIADATIVDLGCQIRDAVDIAVNNRIQIEIQHRTAKQSRPKKLKLAVKPRPIGNQRNAVARHAGIVAQAHELIGNRQMTRHHVAKHFHIPRRIKPAARTIDTGHRQDAIPQPTAILQGVERQLGQRQSSMYVIWDARLLVHDQSEASTKSVRLAPSPSAHLIKDSLRIVGTHRLQHHRLANGVIARNQPLRLARLLVSLLAAPRAQR